MSGVIVSLADESMELKGPDGSIQGYNSSKESSDYYYTIQKMSEVEFKNQIIKNIADLKKAIETKQTELKESMQFLHDYEYEMSLFGRLLKVFKSKN